MVGNIDLVYEALGADQIAFELLEVLGAGGLFCFTGVPRHRSELALNASRLLYNLVLKNQVMLGTVNAGRDAFERAIGDLEAFYRCWPGAVRALITRRFPLEEFREPILKPCGIKNVIVLEGKRA
jgi:hypothetical protein